MKPIVSILILASVLVFHEVRAEEPFSITPAQLNQIFLSSEYNGLLGIKDHCHLVYSFDEKRNAFSLTMTSRTRKGVTKLVIDQIGEGIFIPGKSSQSRYYFPYDIEGNKAGDKRKVLSLIFKGNQMTEATVYSEQLSEPEDGPFAGGGVPEFYDSSGDPFNSVRRGPPLTRTKRSTWKFNAGIPDSAECTRWGNMTNSERAHEVANYPPSY